MEKPSSERHQEATAPGRRLGESESNADDVRAATPLEKRTARQKKAFNQTALALGASIGAVLGAVIGFIVPFVIILVLSTFGGDPSFSIFALVVGAISGFAGLFVGAAAGYLTARNSAGYFLKGKG